MNPQETAERLVDGLESTIFEIGGRSVTPLDVVFAVAIVAAFLLLARWLRAGLERLLRDRLHGRPGLAHALGRITQYAVVTVGFVVGLDQVGVHLTALAATGAIVAVGIGIGLQDITKNVLSGVLLLLERHVQKGDFVIVGDTVGTVQSIELRATRVVSRDGVSIIVPNGELVSGTVINQSQPTGTYRLRVRVGVAYGSDVELVRETLLEVARSHPRVLADPRPMVFFDDFGASSLDFELAAWVDDPQPEPAVKSDLRFAIDAAFRDRGITIAFPQLDLHVVSGLDALREGRGPASGKAAAPQRKSIGPARDTSAEEKQTVERMVTGDDRPGEDP